MIENPIVEEVHRIREELLAEHNGDLKSLIQTLRARTEAAAREGRQVVMPPLPAADVPPEPSRKVG